MNEEAVACPPSAAKRKRSKRPRHMTPTTMSMSVSISTSSSAEVELSGSSTEEEEDMANCLILLAQGRALDPAPRAEEKFTSRRFSEAATTTDGKAGFYVYECKTCSKCFPSFQALGGHRASHKKPKIPPAEKAAAAAVATATATAATDGGDDGLGLGLGLGMGLGLELKMNSFAKSFVSHGKQRVHECSICGSEFSSGQALGGHMRRHRPATASDSTEAKKMLSLDLNLPAPSEEEQKPVPAPGFASLVFSTSAMVDCHY